LKKQVKMFQIFINNTGLDFFSPKKLEKLWFSNVQQLFFYGKYMDIHTKENFLNKLGLDRSGKRGSWFRFVHFLLENLEQKNNFPVFFCYSGILL